jgi:large conductance mechanosensitive channel
MLKEFKAFIMRGNVLDLAVAVIIGGAFGAIVTSLVNDIIMPPIGLLLKGVDFKNLFVNLTNSQVYATLDEAKKAGVATLNYGLFLNAVINFAILALVIFLLVKAANKAMPAPAPTPAPPPTKACPYCTSQIAAAATRCPHCTSSLA